MNKLMWFRLDLRLTDNQALMAAFDDARQCGAKLKAIYIASPWQWMQHNVAPIQIDFIERHLNLLAGDLAKLGIQFELVHIDKYQDIPNFLSDYCRAQQIDTVYASSDPEWNEIQRDQQVATQLLTQEVNLYLFNQHCILPPGTVLNQSKQMYKVFTPFSRRWREIVATQQWAVLPSPLPLSPKLKTAVQCSIQANKVSSEAWRAGEAVAQQVASNFLQQRVADYQAHRDFPAIDGTSQLSPYLALGVVGPRQCLVMILALYPEVLHEESSPARVWLNELIWREFYRHLLVEFPLLSKGANFKANADKVLWSNHPADFDAWCQGQTGYPIIDAAMRQLNQTGWMHNRLRMLVASFLCKHLLIDWRWGETYFKQHLIDGDLAANNGGWQWSAGTGCDAQPYFRIFNPITQSQKFDPQGLFIRKYVPELSHLSHKDIFKPCDVPRHDLLNSTKAYPAAMVCHRVARERALDVLGVMKNQQKSASHEL